METKKPTNAQLQKRIAKAIVHIDRTKDTKEVFFSDTGLRIVINEEYAVITHGFQQHILSRFLGHDISRPYLYLQQVVEIATEEENSKAAVTDDGYSFAKLLGYLEQKEDNTDFCILKYVDMWMFNFMTPVYSIGETAADAFMVTEAYWHNLARVNTLLSEKNKDVTNADFLDAVIDKLREFAKDMQVEVIFHKQTDEELAKDMASLEEEVENEKILLGDREKEE